MSLQYFDPLAENQDYLIITTKAFVPVVPEGFLVLLRLSSKKHDELFHDQKKLDLKHEKIEIRKLDEEREMISFENIEEKTKSFEDKKRIQNIMKQIIETMNEETRIDRDSREF